MDIQHSGIPMKNHKYVARIPLKTVNGKQQWRYFYTQEEWQAYKLGDKQSVDSKTNVTVKRADKNTGTNKKNTVFGSIKDGIKSMSDKSKESVDNFLDEIGANIKSEIDKTPDRLNKAVDKVKKVASDVYDDKDNIYDVNPSNYNDKISKITETPEWKAIVERQDPEYVKKNSDGTTTYLIDDYLAKKKMPPIDVIDDIVNNRPITVNEVDKDAIVAGVKQKIFGTVSIGILGAKVISKALIEQTKLSQGSYNEQVAELGDTMSDGMKFLKDMGHVVDENVTAEDVQQVMSYMQNSSKVAEVQKTVDSINEGKVMDAAKIILNSDNLPDGVTENEYFELAQTSLSNLSDEEIAMLNILINSVLTKK